MTAAAPPTSNNLVIAGSLPCIRCGYDLDKCHISGKCPECGDGVSLSLDSLWLEETSYLRGLRAGVRALIIAALIGPVIYILSALISLFAPDPPGEELVPVVAIALLSGPIVAAGGVWAFARPRPGRMTWSARLLPWAKGLAIAFTSCFALGVFIASIAATGNSPPNQYVVIWTLLATGVLWCLRNIVVLAHFRSLSQIANMPRMARAVPIFQAWSAAIGTGGVVGASIVMFNMLGGPRSAVPSFLVFLTFAYFAWMAASIAWIAAWPIFMARFGNGLKKIIRHHELRGRPTVLDADSSPAPLPAAPPTTLDPSPPTAP